MLPSDPGLGVGVELGGEGGDRGLAAPGALEVHEHEDLLGDAQGVEGRQVDRGAAPRPRRPGRCRWLSASSTTRGRCWPPGSPAAGWPPRRGRRRGPRPAGARRGPRTPGRREGGSRAALDARRRCRRVRSRTRSSPCSLRAAGERRVASTPRAVDRFGGPADSGSPVTLRPHLTMGLPFRRCRLLGAPNWRSRYQGGKRECKGFLQKSPFHHRAPGRE